MSRSTEGIAALLVGDWSLVAYLRSHPERVGEPLALVADAVALRGGGRIEVASAQAVACGVDAGMTVSQARGREPSLVVLPRCVASEDSAFDALRDCAASLSPRVELERTSLDAWAFVDIAGLGRLVGDAHAVAQRLVASAERIGLSARVGVARNKTLARLCARTADPSTILPTDTRAERAFVAALPIEVLDPPEPLRVQLRRFGLRTIGDFIALPRASLVERLGPTALQLYSAARGEEEGLGLRPEDRRAEFAESILLDFEICNLEPLSFVLRSLLDRLVERLQLRGYAAGDLLLSLELVDGGWDERHVRVGAPMRDTRALLSLCRLSLTREPPPQPVRSVRALVQPVVSRTEQLGLFAPQSPAPEQLAVTMARLQALCGQERVGSLEPEDSYRRDGFRMAPFAPDRHAEQRRHRAFADATDTRDARRASEPSRLPRALHRLRPPVAVDVVCEGGRLVRVESTHIRGVILRCDGPFLRTRAWWELREEGGVALYDICLSEGTTYRLAREQETGRWWLEGWYD